MNIWESIFAISLIVIWQNMIDMDKIKIGTIRKKHLVASLNISVVITHSQHVCVYIGRIHQTGD